MAKKSDDPDLDWYRPKLMGPDWDQCTRSEKLWHIKADIVICGAAFLFFALIF